MSNKHSQESLLHTFGNLDAHQILHKDMLLNLIHYQNYIKWMKKKIIKITMYRLLCWWGYTVNFFSYNILSLSF
jgi:hypothetical protein